MIGKPPLKHNPRNIKPRNIIPRKHNPRKIRKREKEKLCGTETTSET